MRATVIALTALLVVGACTPTAPAKDEHEEEGHDEGIHLTKEASDFAGVRLYKVTYKQINETIEVPGTVSSTPAGRALVTPPVSGRIIAIKARIGDKVTRGQILATIESPELAQSWSATAEAERAYSQAVSERTQSQSEVKIAQAKYQSARTTYDRQVSLAKVGAFSQAPLLQATSDLNDAQSELLSIQREQLSHAEQYRRLENLFAEGIVSKAELEAAKLELQQDEIRLSRAKSRIETTKATYEREKKISERGLLNAREVQTAEADLRASKLEVEKAHIKAKADTDAVANAQRAIRNARDLYRSHSGSGSASGGKTTLTAPISGTITRLDMTVGQAADRTQVVAEIENLDTVWVTANVPERDADRVANGAFVTVTLPAHPGTVFHGIVQVKALKIDHKTRTASVQCLIERANGNLKPNTFATVQIASGGLRRALTVPATAVVSEGKENFVYTKHEDDFERVELKLGAQLGSEVEILEGLKEGDEVAGDGVFIIDSQRKKGELKGHDH